MRVKSIVLLIITALLLGGCISQPEDMLARNLGRLEESNPFLRQQAVASLGSLGTEDVILPLAGMLGDDNADVRGQAQLELSKLWEQELPIVEQLLEALPAERADWREPVIAFMIKADIQGRTWEEELWTALCAGDSTEPFRELLVYLNTKDGPVFFNGLIEMLEGENRAIAAQVMLLLDGAGYRPSVVFVNGLSERGLDLDEVSGELLARYAARGSALVGNNPHEQLTVSVIDGEIFVDDRSAVSRDRCDAGDRLWEATSAELPWPVRLALLQDFETPASVQDYYGRLWSGFGDDFYELLRGELDRLSPDPLLHEALVRFMADDANVRERVRGGINPALALRLWYESEELPPTADSAYGVLVTDDSGDLADLYHWRLPPELRPELTEDVRYFMEISAEGRFVRLTDMKSGDTLAELPYTDDAEVEGLVSEALSLLADE